ncbi:MAG: response regulator, partial [Candidatus Xenobia bacterium]
FASEVTRVAREVGTEGKLGGQAQVKGVGGTWKELTDSVNQMAFNLTTQVRSIAQVVTAVAQGDLRRKLVLEARGEIAQLAQTINDMIDTLGLFGQQVTSVAREVGIEGRLGAQANVPGAAGLWRELTDNVNQLAGNLTSQVRAIGVVATAVAQGDLTRTITVEAAGEVGTLTDNINQMIGTLRETTRKNEEQDWLKTNLAKLVRIMQGQRDMAAVGKQLLAELAPLCGAQHGVVYIVTEADRTLKLLATYAYKERKHLATTIQFGEGLVGECAVEKERILLTNVPAEYIQISSGLGEARPQNAVVVPVVFEGGVKAIIELASFGRFSEIQLALLEQLAESTGIVINSIQSAAKTEELLRESQALATKLQTQQEELQQTNIRLEAQARQLKASEEQLKTQQEELQQTNEELQERSRLLGEQKSQVERKNREVERARGLLEEKAQQLALTSKYKSEFLANMSHELRTPLNSLLILSRTLAENPEGNLTGKQVDYARTIRGSGNDLLELINDVLDLSKIEAGMMGVDVNDLRFSDVSEFCEKTFRQVAEAKGVSFAIEVDQAGLPEWLRTDSKRLQQVLKNLLSNAFKFTEQGGVQLRISTARDGWSLEHEILNDAEQVVAFAVMDTGIGIPQAQQMIIWEAFQQADGTTSRKYGGTGLGLSISRELSRLIGGEIRLQSAPGKGSTFTLYIPSVYTPPRRRPDAPQPVREDDMPSVMEPAAETPPPSPEPELQVRLLEEAAQISDDRAVVRPGDRVLLIVEDDVDFAQILLEMVRERGFKGLVATRADQGLKLARQIRPSAITLDLALPDRSGWTVLDALKHDPTTRHIPVHIISVEEDRRRGFKLGAFASLQKPASREALYEAFEQISKFVERPLRRLLVVEDDPAQRESIVALIGNGDVETTAVGTGAEAIEALQSTRFDCMVLDLRLPDISGFELLARMQKELGQADLPVIVYTGRELTGKEETELRRATDAIVLKDARSPERLLDETALFLHRVEANLPPPKRQMLEQVRRRDPVLQGKKVLIVDDDVRNIFALTDLLERQE